MGSVKPLPPSLPFQDFPDANSVKNTKHKIQIAMNQLLNSCTADVSVIKRLVELKESRKKHLFLLSG